MFNLILQSMESYYDPTMFKLPRLVEVVDFLDF